MGCCCARKKATGERDRAAERSAILPARRKKIYFGIRRGKAGFRGVVKGWRQCSDLVLGVPHNVFQGFRTLEEAREFAFACDPPVVARSSCELEYIAALRRSEVARRLEQGEEEG